MNDDEWTQVRLRRDTCLQLKKIGNMGDSYDTVITKLIVNHVENIN